MTGLGRVTTGCGNYLLSRFATDFQGLPRKQWGSTPTSQFVWGVVMWSRLPSHGHEGYGGM